MIIFPLLFIAATIYITVRALRGSNQPTVKDDFRRLFPGKSARDYEVIQPSATSLEEKIRYHDGKSREADKKLTEDARKTEIAELNELWAMQVEESVNQKDKNE